MSKVKKISYILASILFLSGCGISEADVENALNPGTPEYTLPQEIEVGSIKENKKEDSSIATEHKELSLDNEFLSRYINIEEFYSLSAWVKQKISDAKNEFVINEEEYDALEEEINQAAAAIKSGMDTDKKKETLYAALQETNDAVQLDIVTFLNEHPLQEIDLQDNCKIK